MPNEKLLAAAVIVAAQTHPNYWEQQGVHALVRVISDDQVFVLDVFVSPDLSVDELLRIVQTSERLNDGEPLPAFTLLLLRGQSKLHDNESPQDILSSRGLQPTRSVVVLETGGDHGIIIMDSASIDQKYAWAAARLQTAFDALKDPSNRTLREISIISSEEKATILAFASSPNSTESTEAGLFPVIHAYFEKIAKESPEAIALQMEDGTAITYGELERRSNALAAHLVKEQDVRHGDVVLEFFDKGPEMVIGMLGILKAGAAYAPLDIDHPAERTLSIQRQVRSKICLTTASLRPTIIERLKSDFVCNVLAIDVSEFPEHPRPPPQLPASAGDDLCYVMFTSGTTGTPKGVMVHHSAVIASVLNGPESNQRLRKEGQKLRTLMFSNYAFDYSVWDVFLTLSCGGTLCIASKVSMLNDLAGVMRSLSVTFIETTPTVLSLLDPNEVPTLTTVYSSGEALTETVRDRFQPDAVLPTGRDMRLGNGGAPTETTVMSVFMITEKDEELRAYGRPFGGNVLYILDAYQGFCPAGTPGILWIGGPQVSKGYLGRNDLTIASYHTDPCSAAGSKMYKTGDVCLWRDDGVLLYVGRADTQVKIRGQRVEMSEIEGMLLKLPAIRTTAVVKCTIGKKEELVAFVVSNNTSTISTDAIREHLTSQLPVYMVPARILSIPSLPVTSNGKLDRAQLSRMASETVSEQMRAITLAATENTEDTIEIVVRRAWASALFLPESEVSLHEPFFSVGGDSISCIRVVAALRNAGYVFSVTDFVTASTVKEQGLLLARRQSSTASIKDTSYCSFDLLPSDYRDIFLKDARAYGYEEKDIEDAYPGTGTVAGMVSLAVANPLSYFAQYVFESSTVLSSAHMETSWRTVSRRHQVFRSATIIASEPHGGFVHLISTKSPELTFRVFGSDEDRTHAMQEYLKSSPGFALGDVPTRAALFEGPKSSLFILQMHHSQYDGWSFSLILQELEAAYRIASNGAAVSSLRPTIPYSRYVRWNMNQPKLSSLTYWKSQLQSPSLPSWPKVPLFNSRKRAVSDRTLVETWPSGTQLAKFCASHGVTVASFVRTALAVLLSLRESSDDVLFGIVASGRSGDLLGVENIIGPCLATLPCRVRVPSTDPLVSIMQTVHRESVNSIPHQFVGLNEIIQTCSIVDANDLFRVLLVIENLPGLHETTHPFFGKILKGHTLEMNYPLSVIVFPSPDQSELRFQFQWDSEYLSTPDVNAVADQLFTIFESMMVHSDRCIPQSNFLSPKGEEFVLRAGKGCTPNQDPNALLFFHQMVDETAARVPLNIALEHTDGTAMTYEALVVSTNRVAHGLQARGVGSEAMVPVLFEKKGSQMEAVVAFIAILKAGGAFVPLDSAWPVDRLMSCIRQCGSSFLIYSSSTDLIARQLETPLTTIEELSARCSDQSVEVSTLRPDSLSYVMFTSGSTGQPKGVMLEHQNITAYISNGSTVFPLRDAKRFLHFSPWTFDQGLADIFLAFSTGATIVLADMDQLLTDISSVLNTTRVDYAVLTPAIAQLIQAGVRHPYLKTLVCGGEKLTSQLANRWLGKVELVDAYGPTEATVHAISASFRNTEYSPGVIGRPLGNTRAYIVNSAMRLQPVGVSGELLLSGGQVARGYLGLPQETAAVFMDDPFHPGARVYKTGDLARMRSDGLFEYLGRQEGGYIKLRGLRIDIAEIEATLMSVMETFAVVFPVTINAKEHLLAFVSRTLSPAGQIGISLASEPEKYHIWMRSLMKTCKRILPSHSIPTLWLVVDAMPQAASNKFDRKQLRAFLEHLATAPEKIDEMTRVLLAAKAPRMPETATEKELHAIWSQVLNKDEINVHDDFFALGGDSIGVIRVLASLRSKCCDLTIKDFYDATTIASLSRLVESARHAMIASPPGTFDDTQTNGIVFQVQRAPVNAANELPLWLLHCAEGVGHEYMNLLPLARDVYAISNPSKNRMELEVNYPTIDSFTDRYISLLPADADIYLGGYSSGGVLALNLAARRRALGQTVKGVVLFDTFNTAGWKFLGFAPDSDYGSNHISNAINPSPKELQRAQERHTYNLIEAFKQPHLPDVPVLLLRAGIREVFRSTEFDVPPGNDELNFFSRENLPLLEVVNIEGAEHADLVGYKEGFATDIVREVSITIRDWCHQPR